MDAQDKAITLGHPSYVWRFGQERRLNLINRYAPLAGKRILDAGCGLGMYVRAFRRFSDEVYGVDIDPQKVTEAHREWSSYRRGTLQYGRGTLQYGRGMLQYGRGMLQYGRGMLQYGRGMPRPYYVASAEALPFPDGF
ncbi:MAG TPA: methyltransferase domain-containing protein, partial [Anaerolineae bacterium]|nr:methyltransferase domain-containing protein [Anaerolineae bacterium]